MERCGLLTDSGNCGYDFGGEGSPCEYLDNQAACPQSAERTKLVKRLGELMAKHRRRGRPEGQCFTCHGSGRVTRVTPEGLTFREDCPACEGCGSTHAGISPDELLRDGYDNEPRPVRFERGLYG